MDNLTDLDLELDDLWIDAIPENPYDICPCGCGKKFKFVKDNILEHEMKFKENALMENL